jgi:preprotein translocase subunit SecG
MNSVLYYFLATLHVTASILLVFVVLLQQGKGQDLASAFGGGGTQTAFGPRGSANVLSRVTTVLAGIFMATSLTLSLVRVKSNSPLDRLSNAPAKTTPASPAAAPASPKPAGK